MPAVVTGATSVTISPHHVCTMTLIFNVSEMRAVLKTVHVSSKLEVGTVRTALSSVKVNYSEKGQPHCGISSPEVTSGFGTRPTTL